MKKELWIYYRTDLKTFADLTRFISKEFPDISFDDLNIEFGKFAIFVSYDSGE